MFFQFIRLQFLKTVRSVSLGRKIINGVLVTVFGFFILLGIMGVGFGLAEMLRNITGRYNVTPVLNTLLIFFFLLEIMYRFFLQKMTVLELQHYLHLPIGRPKIINFLLLRSFISPYNLVAILLFTPFYWTEVTRFYSSGEAILWLLNILFISWSIHWLMLLYKQKYGDTIKGFLVLLGVFAIVAGTFWYQWLNIRIWIEPIFTAPLKEPIIIIMPILLFCSSYWLVYRFYYNHSYLEELQKKKKWRTIGDKLSLFKPFGVAGTVADLELKLILRHKKSRAYLFISLLFLAYGFVFYTDDMFNFSEGIPWMAVGVGIILTGMFIMQYGQLYLSWNSPYFDFFLSRSNGLYNLIQGKYILFATLCFISFILTIPYIYFGTNILYIHAATFLFNIGIDIHLVVALALWKPKPMDLDRSTMFNYEGIGIAQFLMAIPVVGAPYAIYLPVSYLLGDFIALGVLALTGIAGIYSHKKINEMHARRIRKNRYAISASFRQEI